MRSTCSQGHLTLEMRGHSATSHGGTTRQTPRHSYQALFHLGKYIAGDVSREALHVDCPSQLYQRKRRLQRGETAVLQPKLENNLKI